MAERRRRREIASERVHAYACALGVESRAWPFARRVSPARANQQLMHIRTHTCHKHSLTRIYSVCVWEKSARAKLEYCIAIGQHHSHIRLVYFFGRCCPHPSPSFYLILVILSLYVRLFPFLPGIKCVFIVIQALCINGFLKSSRCILSWND